MHHTMALFASFSSVGLICAIYYCNILSHPDSRLRSELLAMILLALLVSLYPVAVTASLFGLCNIASAGLSLGSVVAAGADLLAIGASVLAAYLFRVLVKATYRTSAPVRGGLSPAPLAQAAI